MDENEKNFQDELRSQLFRNSFRAARGYRSAINAQSDLNQQLNSSIQGGLQRRADVAENRKRRQLEYDRLATDAGLRRREAAQVPMMQSPLLSRVSSLLGNPDEKEML